MTFKGCWCEVDRDWKPGKENEERVTGVRVDHREMVYQKPGSNGKKEAMNISIKLLHRSNFI